MEKMERVSSAYAPVAQWSNELIILSDSDATDSALVQNKNDVADNATNVD